MNRNLLVASLTLFAACAAQPIGRPDRVPPPLPPAVPPMRPPQTNPTDESATQAWLAEQSGRQARPPAAAPATNPTDESATQAWLRATASPGARPNPPAGTTNPTDEAATRAWLQEQVDHQNRVNPERPPEPVYQYVDRVVERPVYVDRTVWRDRWVRPSYYGVGYDAYGEPVYAPRYYYREPGYDFPVNTALGAGVGAIIGYQSHHAARGAWIGGGVGLLLDLARVGRW